MPCRGFSIALLAITVLVLGPRISGQSAPVSPFARVRPIQPRGLDLLVKGYQRSPTMHRLVDTLERSDVFVYLDVNNHLAILNGHVQLTAVTPAGRYLRANVDTAQPESLAIATIAHELQHAIEIAGAPEVVDQRTLRAFYVRTGVARRQRDEFDSIAAQQITDTVRAELARPILAIAALN